MQRFLELVFGRDRCVCSVCQSSSPIGDMMLMHLSNLTEQTLPMFSFIHIHKTCSFGFYSTIYIIVIHACTLSEWYNSPHLSFLRRRSCKSPSEMCHLYSKCQTSASNHLSSPSPLLSFISLSKTQPFNPACLCGHIHSWVSWKSTPSPLQIHANHNI